MKEENLVGVDWKWMRQRAKFKTGIRVEKRGIKQRDRFDRLTEGEIIQAVGGDDSRA